ncbi:hypothetical protein J437_LFUL018915 [Ladona fulva]|uniref:Uncharacterized protein n=1 Tax=Ladona fulva TaxID=123851 RepID=A0A8K0KRU8_LADFU|nr:hypothetical protein J437_LFUL018915 [Ladona fulva]
MVIEKRYAYADMKFSEAFVCSKRLNNFSPDGKLIAGANNQELYVISADSLRPIHSIKFGEKIDYIEWSSDSLYLLCASFNAAVVRVFSIENPTWKCKISEGTAGLVSVCWSPDSRHILTTATFHIQISVWSLLDETVSYVHYVKEGKPGMAFSPDGSYLAILERRETKDHILVLSCSTWTPFLVIVFIS